ncbi:MAG: twin-arginine translocase TatA/TatE family subunit [Dehalococcoidia bacterium]|nr:twin-arginine translocase TatA/TatE family subunit [Dehalococcoidia bacterium]
MLLAVGPFGLGPMELVIILLVLVMLFGATRLADLGGSLGKGIREFRRNVQSDDDEDDEGLDKPVAAQPAANGSAQNGAETVAAVKCPSCGALNTAGAKHCNQCGAAITAPVS